MRKWWDFTENETLGIGSSYEEGIMEALKLPSRATKRKDIKL